MTIKAHFDGKVIVPDEPVNLPAGQSLLVQVEAAPASCDKTSVLEWIAKNAIDDPEAPTDLSYQHDHYLYGTAKKP